MNEIDLERIEQKTYRESMRDGLSEIFLGIFLIGTGALFTIKLAAMFVVFVLLFFPRIVERLKRKFTYPRIGYAKLHEVPPRKTALGIFSYMVMVTAVMVLALFIMFGDVSAALWYRWSPAFVGAALAGAFIYEAGRSGDSRNYGIAVFGLVTGVVLSVYGFETMWTGLVVYLLFMGSCFVGLGLVRFLHFLQEYPVREEVIDE